MRVAALDLGSNTFLCLIVEIENRKIIKTLFDGVEVVRLGQDVNKTKKLHPEAIKRAEACLQKFNQEIKKFSPDMILAMATSAARDAQNKEELFAIGRKLGIPIEIIPGNQEAEITYKGAISGFDDINKARLIIDIGGGSTEVIYGQGQQVLQSKSLNIGCVRLTEKFISKQPASEQEFTVLSDFIQTTIEKELGPIRPNNTNYDVVAVAGTPTELARIEIGGKFDPQAIDQHSFSLERLLFWIEQFKKRTPQQISQELLVSSGRADVILVGVLILQKLCAYFKKEEILVSTRGVRFGVALEAASRSLQ